MRTSILLLACFVLSACSSNKQSADNFADAISSLGKRPKLQHIVLFDLSDPADANAFAHDSLKLLAIPGVTDVSAGRHIDVGRANAIADYDVAVLVGLKDVPAYRAYLAHPIHEELIMTWRSRITSSRIIDFGWTE